MNLTFRVRLILWFFLTLALLLGATACGLYYALSYVAQEKFDSALWILGTAETEGIVANLKARDLQNPDNQTVVNHQYRELLGFDERAVQKYVTVVDAQHRAADFSENLASPLPFDERLIDRSLSEGRTLFQTMKIENAGDLRTVYLPVRGFQDTNIQPFVVIVGLPENFIDGEMSELRRLVFLIVGGLLALTSLSAYFLARRAIRPVTEIARAAEKISVNNLKERLPDHEANDEIGRLVRVFNQMLARLEQSFEAQQRFSQRVAHEFRTPLTILKGENQVALNRRRSMEEYEAQLRSNLEEAEKMEQTVDNLLLFSRYEAGETEMPSRAVKIGEIAHRVAADIKSLAESRRIKLEIAECEDTEVFGDEEALERLIYKLIENAVLYTTAGGTVRVRCYLARNQAILEIEDTGIGIAPEDVPNVFERFYRTSRSRHLNPKGSGIGLAIVAAVAKLHRAAIEVESHPDKGTKFTVKFPSS